MRKFLTLGLVAVLGTPVQASSLTNIFDSFFVLGDSLSDNGNTADLAARLGSPLPVSPLQEPGVASDGFTWAKQFTDEFGAAGANLSFGGARATANTDFVPDLPAQIDSGANALPGVPKYSDGIGGLNARIGDGSGRELVTIFIGGNDFLDQATPTGLKLAAAAEAAANAELALAAQLLAEIDDDLGVLVNTTLQTVIGAATGIMTNGVDDLLVMNLPDFSLIPRFNGALGAVGETLAQAAKSYNELLAEELEKLRSDRVSITLVDVFGALSDDDLLASAGIVNKDDACVFSVVQDCKGFLYFDSIHPASQGHDLIAQLTREGLDETYNLAAVPLPTPASMLISAVGGMLVLRRRRRVA